MNVKCETTFKEYIAHYSCGGVESSSIAQHINNTGHMTT